MAELENSLEEKVLMAELLIYNQALVDDAIQVVRTALAKKRSWSDIEKMHAVAVKNGDHVAEAIVKFDLNNNRIVLRLSDGEEGASPEDVAVSIDVSAHVNACNYYKEVKDAAEEPVRTEIAAERATKNAKEKALTTIKECISKARSKMWFEKFLWFISSENYLVVGGRDATQNKFLARRYLGPEDVYLHAEADNGASVVIRNKPGGGEIPPKTLIEAAQMATCYTEAWWSQTTPSSWWVYGHQVSRVTQTGMQATLVVRGEKNYLPSSILSIGFGILFCVDEVSAHKHQKKLQLVVPLARPQLEDSLEETSFVDIAPKPRKKKNLPTKEEEKRKEPLDVAQEDEEAHQQELQGPEEDDAEDDLTEFAETEGTEVLIAQLVSNPGPEDVLLYAVPMVGPYEFSLRSLFRILVRRMCCFTLCLWLDLMRYLLAFHDFKYKAKIKPGATRRGKAGRAAIDLFLRNRNAGQVEKELIRAMANGEEFWINIPHGCHVFAPQLHANK
ncbi:hypothetical protein OESDEN_05007 [Oesophagostomum dentatum]|uniref:NFACT RNA-binding domain-containing protein n=1 Tax=Oesophagostomum dentatum TaxID=61180 RepID=A0A0B1TG27_OESDE|nr:hypothetical protein OESDEN_05007 [Oesophagostomum dentatum]